MRGQPGIKSRTVYGPTIASCRDRVRARMKMLIDPKSLIHLASGATVVSVSLPASVAGAGVVVVVVVVVVI